MVDSQLDLGRDAARRFVGKMSLKELLDEYEQSSHMVGYNSDKGGHDTLDWWCGHRDEIRREVDSRLGTFE